MLKTEWKIDRNTDEKNYERQTETEKTEGETDWHTKKMNEIQNIKLTERQTEKQIKREKDKVEVK